MLNPQCQERKVCSLEMCLLSSYLFHVNLSDPCFWSKMICVATACINLLMLICTHSLCQYGPPSMPTFFESMQISRDNQEAWIALNHLSKLWLGSRCMSPLKGHQRCSLFGFPIIEVIAEISTDHRTNRSADM